MGLSRFTREVSPERQRAWCRKGQETLQRKRWQSIAAKLKTCRTLGDAYRLGRKDGYLAGWMRGRRSLVMIGRRGAA